MGGYFACISTENILILYVSSVWSLKVLLTFSIICLYYMRIKG